MVLEATIVCVDNSEYSRNGDFAPSRFAAQVDSVNMLCSAKVQANAESSVGLLTLAGRSARILVTSTRDLGQVFSCMHDVKYDGTADFVAGIQKAQLALKHRQNTMQRQRIVVFISSPIKADVETLVKLGKKLKKNQVAVDVINVGVEGDNKDKIDAFIGAVNSGENSHALHIPANGTTLSDMLRTSEIYVDRDSAAAASSGGVAGASGGGGDGTANEYPFGVDPVQDPELAMVLRISMEEERARQEAAARERGEMPPSADSAAVGGESGTADNAGAAYDEDEDLYGSGAGDDKMDVDRPPGPSSSAAAAANDDDDEELDEETRRAIELSKTDFNENADGDSKN